MLLGLEVIVCHPHDPASPPGQAHCLPRPLPPEHAQRHGGGAESILSVRARTRAARASKERRLGGARAMSNKTLRVELASRVVGDPLAVILRGCSGSEELLLVLEPASPLDAVGLALELEKR